MTSDGSVLVTGAFGFVGGAVLRRLMHDGSAVRAAVSANRPGGGQLCGDVRPYAIDLRATSDWTVALEGVKAVLHCAARVHIMNERALNPLAEFRRVNVDGTLNLARQAADMGVRRFVFVSSIGVNGASTGHRPFRACDDPAPHSAYTRSKLEAEIGLRQLARETGLEVVIVRPPLVYGPNAPGNFEQLMRVVYRKLPLPFGAIRNRRSFVALDNLVDLLVTAARHPGAVNRTLLVSDGQDLSTPDLIRRLAAALQRPARLLPIPPSLIRRAAALLGRRDLAQRLCDSLEVDIAETRTTLNWVPPVDVDSALRSAARAFLGRMHA